MTAQNEQDKRERGGLSRHLSHVQTSSSKLITISVADDLLRKYGQRSGGFGEHCAPLDDISAFDFDRVDTKKYLSLHEYRPDPWMRPVHIEMTDCESSGLIWDCYSGNVRWEDRHGQQVKVAVKICRPTTYLGPYYKDMSPVDAIEQVLQDGRMAEYLARMAPNVVPAFYGLFLDRNAGIFVEILEHVGSEFDENDMYIYGAQIKAAYRALHAVHVVHGEVAERHVRLRTIKDSDQNRDITSDRLIDFDRADIHPDEQCMEEEYDKVDRWTDDEEEWANYDEDEDDGFDEEYY